MIGIYCDSQSGEKENSLLPKRVGKKTKYPLNLCLLETLYSAGQVGGGSEANLRSSWLCQNVIRILAGKKLEKKKVQLRL